jgi:cupin fold WbuC family metalloprotein
MLDSLQKISDEVFVERNEVVRHDKRYVDFIKKASLSSTKGRARICMHKGSKELIHEMLISISSKSYIRPHKHFNKSESFHLVEGEADIVLFSDNGKIIEVIPFSKENNFYYRLDHSCFHTLLIKSPLLVIHEVTNGPFNAGDAEFAKFAPADDPTGSYLEDLKKMALVWKEHKNA